MPAADVVTVHLRDGTPVRAQWWHYAATSDTASWYRPVTPVPWDLCRPGGCLLVDPGTLRETCCTTHATDGAPPLDHGTGDLLALLDGGTS